MIKSRAMELVAALRSGKYKQGRHTLFRDDKYCCLGVACNISRVSKFVQDPDRMPGEYYYDGERAVLPDSVKKYFGLRYGNGRFSNPIPVKDPILGDLRHCSTLTELNDMGWTFEQIAAFIEKHWEEL
jgi:hypothetical protein